MTRQQELGLMKEQEPFEGNYCARMHELRASVLTPWSTGDVMDARNKVSGNHPLWNNYFDTDFGIAGTEKKIYLVPHSARLRAVTPETELTSGGLPLDGDALSGARAYRRNDLILDHNLTEEEARSSLVWQDFANRDQNLLDKYVEKAFRFGKDRFGYDKMMGIFVQKEKQPIERAVVLGRLLSRSLADGGCLGGLRLVGVRGGSFAEGDAKNQGPYRTATSVPRSELEIVLDEFKMADPAELRKALQLYDTAKNLKL